jgi:dihydrofolate reductase
MGELTYLTLCSLDGYTADGSGDFSWAAPDAEVHSFVNDLERDTGLHLYGRRMYETMVYWDTIDPDPSTIEGDYAAIWQGAEKIVYSRTLDEASTPRTRIEREFDPEAVRSLKDAAGSDVSVGGPELAGQALAAGLVDEIRLFVVPEIVGGGSPALPDGVRASLELLDERRFGNGTVYLRYRVA